MARKRKYKKKPIPLRLRTYITLRDNGICQICGEKGILKRKHCYVFAYDFSSTPFESSHIVPESRGGKTIAENLILLCRKCNRHIGDNIINGMD